MVGCSRERAAVSGLVRGRVQHGERALGGGADVGAVAALLEVQCETLEYSSDCAARFESIE